MSMEMKLNAKSKFKRSQKPSPCTSGRRLRKRDVIEKVLRYFRKMKRGDRARECVPAPEQASTKNTPMVEHLIELDLPFAKLDDKTFLEYPKKFLVNKSPVL